MVKKNDIEKIDNLNEKIQQLQAQKKQLEARVKEKERKARTRRLIQIGAVLDNMGMNSLECANIFKNEVENNQKLKSWFEKLMNKDSNDNA